jgi:predicted RNase H-like HicB family nuclease
MEYRIVLKKGQDGYFVAQCLEAPGAISQGRTKPEAIRNAKEALELVLEVLKEEASDGDRPGARECLSCPS